MVYLSYYKNEAGGGDKGRELICIDQVDETEIGHYGENISFDRKTSHYTGNLKEKDFDVLVSDVRIKWNHERCPSVDFKKCELFYDNIKRGVDRDDGQYVVFMCTYNARVVVTRRIIDNDNDDK